MFENPITKFRKFKNEVTYKAKIASYLDTCISNFVIKYLCEKNEKRKAYSYWFPEI